MGMILCVALADYLTGTETSLILFYLAPIGFGTWFISLRGGVFLSFASASVSFAADALHRAYGPAGHLPVPVLVWNGLMQLGTASALVLVLAALRGRLEGEELLARTDALTRISNRRAFFEAAALEIERARRSLQPLTLAYVDCDDFKDVNDRLGHAQGDALLATVAQTLRANVRATDAVARLGGDEFGVLLPETNAEEAAALLSRLHAALLSAMASNGWSVGFSAGAATFLGPPASIDEMMARADALMYAAKRESKGSMRLATYPASHRMQGGPAAAGT
jgi:diguanylate cyclase (GGDEF)-like protein